MSWTCNNCQTVIEEDHFSECWKFSISHDGAHVNTTNERDCLRCKVDMELLGPRSFHERNRWGVLGDLTELLVNKEAFNLYVCPIYLTGNVE